MLKMMGAAEGGYKVQKWVGDEGKLLAMRICVVSVRMPIPCGFLRLGFVTPFSMPVLAGRSMAVTWHTEMLRDHSVMLRLLRASATIRSSVSNFDPKRP